MIVDGNVDPVLFAQLFDRVEGILARLGDERFGAHLLGVLEHLAALRGILGKGITRVVGHDSEACVGQFLLCRRPHVGKRVLAQRQIRLILAQPQDHAALDIAQAQEGSENSDDPCGSS